MSDRTLGILFCSLVSIFIFRNEVRMDRLEDRLDQVIDTKEAIKYTKQDLECLTKNIYYEAGIEDRIGKYAVGHVTINRLNAGRWGDTICKVVYSKAQFSWTLKKKLPKPNPIVYEESREIALDILAGARIKGLRHSLYYHADYIRIPHWADAEQHVLTIGRHIFYNKAKESKTYI